MKGWAGVIEIGQKLKEIKMERVKYEVTVGSPEYESLKKQNEIVDWINNHNKQKEKRA